MGRSPGEPGSDEPSAWESYALAIGALAAAVMTLVIDDHSPVTVLLLTVALIPWALTAGGVRLPIWLFVLWTLAPATAIVAADAAGGPILLAVLTVTRVFSLTADRVTRTATIAAALILPLVVLLVDHDSGADAGAVYFAAGLGVGAMTGNLIHRQRELTAKLRWSLGRLDAAAEERRRIAREVHDVVAHSLTVVMLNVSGARKAMATHPEPPRRPGCSTCCGRARSPPRSAPSPACPTGNGRSSS